MHDDPSSKRTSIQARISHWNGPGSIPIVQSIAIRHERTASGRRVQKLFGGTYKSTEHTHINPGGRVFWLPKTIVQVPERDADHVVYPHGLLLLLASTLLSF